MSAATECHNVGEDPGQAHFTDGMVDDIITGLSRIKWLFVIGRGTTFSYKGRTVAPGQVGRELGVRYLLEGSVRKVADRVRINCQLVDATGGAHLWAERYDRKLDDVFALQDEIACAVVAAMEPGLQRAEIERVRRKRPDSLDAYELLLKAQPDVDSGMPEQVTRALVLLEKSLAVLPTYALAHANAAMCHHCLFLRAGLKEANRSASLRHAEAAMTFGQDDARALTLAGFSVGMDGHDRAGAFTAFEAALALSPSCALAYILGSVVAGWGVRRSAPSSGASKACASARLILGRLPPTTRRRSVISVVVATRTPPAPPTSPIEPTRPTASPMCR
jgi:TolB-like protein